MSQELSRYPSHIPVIDMCMYVYDYINAGVSSFPPRYALLCYSPKIKNINLCPDKALAKMYINSFAILRKV